MFEIKYIRVVDDYYHQSNEKETAWNNLIEAIKTHNLHLVTMCVSGWCKANPDKYYTDLENKLRESNLDLYLIAGKHDNNTDKSKLISQFDYISECKYVLIYSCKQKNDAIKELLTHSSSYEENLSKLNYSGILVDITYEFENKPHPTQKAYDEIDNNTLIQNNFVRIEIKTILENMEEILNRDISLAQEHFNKEVTIEIIGMAKDDSIIAGFYIDDNIISEIGVIIGYHKDKQKKFISLNNQESWAGFT